MKSNEALKLVGGLSKPSKMPGWAYGIPAKECKTGKKLQNIEGSTCYNCYALKGCYVFKVVQDAQYRRLAASSIHTGSELWFTCCNLKNQNILDGTTLVMCRTSSI
jgi:hypothetical protein